MQSLYNLLVENLKVTAEDAVNTVEGKIEDVEIKALIGGNVAKGDYNLPLLQNMFLDLTESERNNVIVKAIEALNKYGIEISKDLGFLATGGFINYLYLRRNIGYVIDDSKKDNLSLVTANPYILDFLAEKGLLIEKTGEPLDKEKGDFKKAKENLNNQQAIKKQLLENKLAVVVLEVNKVRGENKIFNIKTQKRVIDISGLNTDIGIFMYEVVDAFAEALTKKLSNGVYKYEKWTDYGVKEHIITSNKELVYKVYGGKDNIDERLRTKIENVKCGFNITDLKVLYYNLEGSEYGKLQTAFHPTSLKSLKQVDINSINTNLHKVSLKALRESMCNRVYNTDVAKLKEDYKDIQVPDGTSYKQAIVDRIQGLNDSNLIDISSLYKEIVLHSKIYGNKDELLQEAKNNSVDPFVQFGGTQGFKTLNVTDYNKIKDITQTHIVCITFYEKNGMLNTVYGTKNLQILQKYDLNWVVKVPKITRVKLAQNLIENNRAETDKILTILGVKDVVEKDKQGGTTIAILQRYIMEQADKQAKSKGRKENQDNFTIYSVMSGHSYIINLANLVEVKYSEEIGTPLPLIDILKQDSDYGVYFKSLK